MAIVAVTGHSRAGKSTVISNLAVKLSQDKKIVACVPCDWRYPSLQKFFGVKIATERSIGHIASGDSPGEVLTEHEQSRLLFVAGIADTENCFDHEPPETKTIRTFFANLADSADYVLIEAGDVQFNRMAYLAIEAAQIIVNVITPNVQGLAWHEATAPMLSRCCGSKPVITVVNADKDGVAKLDSAVELPYSKHVARSADKGLPVLLDTSVNCRRYAKAIGKLAQIIRDGGEVD